MIRARDHRVKLLALAGVLAIVVIAAVLWSSSAKTVGALRVAATFSDGRGISEIEYKITGNDIPVMSGRARVADPSAPTEITVKKIPAANGYQLELTAASADGNVKCSRREAFDVELDRTTSLTLVVGCRDLGRIAQFIARRKEVAAQIKTGAVAAVPPIEVPPDCTECEKAGIASGECEAAAGCEGLEGEDKQLCVNLLNCMRATNCWVKDPLDCLCGTVPYTECITHANGDCRAEMQAATRTTDPIKNGTLFFDISVPAGHANLLISCDKEKCKDRCAL